MLQALILTALLTTSDGDEKAMHIADQLMEALGGQDNWDQARFVRYTNVRRNRKTVITWDKWQGRLRVEAMNDNGIPFVILMNLNSRQGNAYLDGKPLSGEELSEFLKRGAQMWKGSHYWFLMPLKWHDPGVTLDYAGEEQFEGNTYDVVRLTFDDGRDPGDQYWGYVNRETHLMDRWKIKLHGGFEGDYTWTNWHRYGGVRVATQRKSKDEVIRFEDIFIGASMPDELFTSPEPVKFP